MRTRSVSVLDPPPSEPTPPRSTLRATESYKMKHKIPRIIIKEHSEEEEDSGLIEYAKWMVEGGRIIHVAAIRYGLFKFAIDSR
ncbi:hypothetical protein QR680_003097 [Steinernema hermaphroditum]|uniref:Uncharacterized protein n=1 Tax=Steinernema hermaphroditum TaxID=289476 RepID=A0AA39H5D6_9BILA|nr:hypothetical protein QR680_003097 [Steinernema hermaphroditum]